MLSETRVLIPPSATGLDKPLPCIMREGRAFVEMATLALDNDGEIDYKHSIVELEVDPTSTSGLTFVVDRDLVAFWDAICAVHPGELDRMVRHRQRKELGATYESESVTAYLQAHRLRDLGRNDMPGVLAARGEIGLDQLSAGDNLMRDLATIRNSAGSLGVHASNLDPLSDHRRQSKTFAQELEELQTAKARAEKANSRNLADFTKQVWNAEPQPLSNLIPRDPKPHHWVQIVLGNLVQIYET